MLMARDEIEEEEEDEEEAAEEEEEEEECLTLLLPLPPDPKLVTREDDWSFTLSGEKEWGGRGGGMAIKKSLSLPTSIPASLPPFIAASTNR